MAERKKSGGKKKSKKEEENSNSESEEEVESEEEDGSAQEESDDDKSPVSKSVLVRGKETVEVEKKGIKLTAKVQARNYSPGEEITVEGKTIFFFIFLFFASHIKSDSMNLFIICKN